MNINKGLIKGSVILLVAFGLYNLLNFIFQASMARLLTLAEFGILSALYQLIYLFSGISESIQITMVKFSANEHNKGKMKNILKRALRKSAVLTVGLFLVYLLVAIPISLMLKIDYLLVSVTGLMLFMIFFTPITRGILQGKKKFVALGLNMLIESAVKLVLSIILVILSWSVLGALVGTIVGGAAAFALTFVSLREFTQTKEGRAETKEIYDSSRPSFIIILAILVFYTFDVLMIKVFFSPEAAGSYAIASLMAKAIFFGTQPISKAMFPLSAENNLEKHKAENILVNAIVMVSILAIVALCLFYFVPGLVIKIFSGKFIPEIESLLLYLGIGMAVLSISNLLLLYKLSVGKTKNYKAFLLFVIAEILILGLFMLYFSPTLVGFSIAFVISAIIFLLGAIFIVGPRRT